MPVLATIVSVVLAVVLLSAGVSKLARPGSATIELRSLGGPDWLDQRWIAVAHPAAELVVGVLLLVTTGAFQTIMAVVVLAIFCVYLLLVVNALRTRPGAECSCFGGLRTARITHRTVWRNTWLVVLALVAVATALSGHSARELMSEQSGWQSLVAAAVAAVTVWLILGHDGKERVLGSSIPVHAGTADLDLEDYIRCRTPAVPVHLADGAETTLREVSRSRAQLLLAVSPTCGACTETMAQLHGWRQAMPQIDIRLLLTDAPGSSSYTSTTEPQSLHDAHSYAQESLDIVAFPTAILLGADGSLAGGPVVGTDQVAEFVAQIQHELEGIPAETDEFGARST